MAPPTRIPPIYQEHADLLRTLGHPARIAILGILRDGEQCVCHMEAMLGLRQSRISQHLMVLRQAGLVEDRRDGWNVFYRLTRPEIAHLTEALGSITGRRFPKLAHSHTAGDCPCPKCAEASRSAPTARNPRHENS